MTSTPFSTELLCYAQLLSTTYLGLANGIFEAISKKPLRPENIAESVNCNVSYVACWMDVAIDLNLVKLDKDGFLKLSELTDSLQISRSNPDAARILQAVYSVLISDAMVPYFRNGHQPGYSIVEGFNNIAPFYGAISESLYGSVFDVTVLPQLSFLTEIMSDFPTVLDFGCGDGWIMRRMAQTYPMLKYLGVTFSQPHELPDQENIEYITNIEFEQDQRLFDLIVLNKILHHLGENCTNVLKQLIAKLAQNGRIMIWEFAWPPETGTSVESDDRTFLNLIEHVQNSKFIETNKIISSLISCGMAVNTVNICEGREVVIFAFLLPIEKK